MKCLIERAYKLNCTIKRAGDALKNGGMQGIKEEVILIRLAILYSRIIRRIERRHLTKVYSDYVAKQENKNN